MLIEQARGIDSVLLEDRKEDGWMKGIDEEDGEKKRRRERGRRKRESQKDV